MATILDTRRIRRSTPSQLRDYYKDLLNHNPIDDISQHLLGAIERGSIIPISFAPWLGVAKSPHAIGTALRQDISITVRKHAIKQLGRALCSSRWKQTWNGLGGTSGLLEIFSNLSVNEVRETCRLLGRCGKGGEILEKRMCITELFMGLQPHIFPNALFKTTDKRPLAKFYRHLIPSCEENVVERIVTGDLKGKWRLVRAKYLMRAHSDVLRREQIRALKGESDIKFNHERFEGLLTQYPKGTSTIPGFSSSMEFSLDVLRQLVDNDPLELEDDSFINDLLRPLLRRAIKKKAQWPNIQQIVDLMMQYLRKHPDVGKEISTTGGDVLYLVAVCWTRKPEMFQKQLRTLCSHPIFSSSARDDLTEWEDFLVDTPMDRRYSLLRLCFQESNGWNIDNAQDLKKVKGSLSNEILDGLRPQEALDLLIRFRGARGEGEDLVVVHFARLMVDFAPKFEGTGADPDLYHVTLLNRNGDCEEARRVATQHLDIRKKKAQSASTPEQRTYYAKSALYYAIASGDPQLYQTTLDWTKRFLRDPLVFRELYPRYFPQEVVRLLSGVPECLRGLTAADLKTRVESGNSILQSMFDTALLALGEPSFQESDWEGVLNLFRSVVEERFSTSKKLKKLLGVSDDDMFSMLWDDTIQALLAVEEKANSDSAQRLGADSMRGILDCAFQPSSVELDTKELSTYTFLDKFAEARDEYWQRLRLAVHPTVSTLPKSFIRGLPVQHLTGPWVIDAPDLEDVAPYIASRVKAAVFPDPSAACVHMPEDEDSQAAIGTFADSHQHALQMFVPKSCTKSERTERIWKAWNYAVGPLSQARMSEEEAIRFWTERRSKYPEDWPPPAISSAMQKTWPIIPEVEDPTEPQEWNPFVAGRPDAPSRDIGEITYLDLSLNIHITTHDIKLRSAMPLSGTVEVPANEVSQDWVWHPSRNMGEGGVLSAFMFLERMYGAPNGRLLDKPFPSADDARYPSLRLSEEFKGDSLNKYNAIRYTHGHIDNIPPALLCLAARNLMDAFWNADDNEGEQDPGSQELGISPIVRLSESDRPALARDMAVKTILHRPKASSWHRQLLKPNFLRRLSAADARTCFENFADAVFENMQDKADRQEVIGETSADVSVTDTATVQHSLTQLYVKVTTVKSMAQLLRDTEFVGVGLAFSVLSTLLEKATHVDVRMNTIKTLLSMLGGSPFELSENILAALESIVPLTGNLNEREPLTEDDWNRAEETLSPPDYPELLDGSSPVLTLLLEHYGSGSMDTERLQAYVDRIILPTMNRLKQQTARWVALFLRKYGVVETEQHVPPLSGRHTNLIELLDKDGACFLPRVLLEEIVAYVLFNIAPPQTIEALNQKFRADPALRSQADVQAWLSLYGKGIDAIEIITNIDMLALLCKPTKLPSDTGITSLVVQRQFLKLFTAAVSADAPLYPHVTTLLDPILCGKHLTKPWWPTQGKSLVSAMIAHVESIRTREWERDAKRTPSVLPNIFPWRLMLLDYPWPDKEENHDIKCQNFATQLGSIVNGITGGIYHIKLAQLKTYLELDPISSTAPRNAEKKVGKYTIYYEKRDRKHDELVRNRVVVALYLGDVNKTRLSWLTLPDVLKVEVAGHLLAISASDDDDDVIIGDLKERVKTRLEEWKACENEDVRRLGWELIGKWDD
jgi:hypothetical protein